VACLERLNRIQPDDNRTGPVTLERERTDALGRRRPLERVILGLDRDIAANKSSMSRREVRHKFEIVEVRSRCTCAGRQFCLLAPRK
jgi:hypothetical protein